MSFADVKNLTYKNVDYAKVVGLQENQNDK